MKKIISLIALITCVHTFSQKHFHKKELVSIDNISIFYDQKRLFVNVKNNKPLQFKILKNNKIILSGSNGMGEESFPVMIGRYKLILFCGNGDTKTKHFRI
jgi:ATPase subunit of ABC transporter with duplicated ATPase domains